MMTRFFSLTMILLWAICGNAQVGQDWTKKVSRSLLAEARSGGHVPFMVMMRRQADLTASAGLNTREAKAGYVFAQLQAEAELSQKDILDELRLQHIPFSSFFIVNAIYTQGDIHLLEAIARRQDVAFLAGDPAIHFAEPVEWMPDVNTSRNAVEWGIDMINADDVWALGFRGQGILVGGADTGYEWDHPALKQQYQGYNALLDTAVHDYSWHDAIHQISPLAADSINPCGLDVPEPCDDRGHGTHTMGTMIGFEGENQIGVAPEAKWCACRNMERGWGAPSTYLECFQWFLAPTDIQGENPDPARAPHVINNSWYCSEEEGCDSTNWIILEMAVNNLKAAGTVVVVSAGNSGSGCSTIAHPAAMFENSFSVGATAINDTIAGFSSRGPVTVDGSNRMKPNVAAPGVGIRSARPGGTYGGASGTSMAGPHVAGLVALMLSANPLLSGRVDVIEDIIEQTAVPKTTDQVCGDIAGTAVPNHTYGFGRVDALAAVQAALEWVETGSVEVKDHPIVRAFPNPAHESWMVDLRAVTPPVRIDIFDVHGRRVHTIQSTSQSIFRIDVSAWAPGMYSYAIRYEDSRVNGRMIKL